MQSDPEAFMRNVYRNVSKYTTEQQKIITAAQKSAEAENKENLDLQEENPEPKNVPIVTRKDENLFQRVKAFHKILKP